MSTDKKWYDILAVIDTKTKVMALIALVVNGALLATLPFLPSNQRIWSLVICAAVLVVTLIGLFRVELAETSAKSSPTDMPSGMQMSSTDESLLNLKVNAINLKDKLVKQHFLPDLIIGIARSGLAVAGFLSKEFGNEQIIPVISLCRTRGQPGFDNPFNYVASISQAFDSHSTNPIKKILIVDEFCDSGRTLYDAKEYVKKFFNSDDINIETAVFYLYEHHDYVIEPSYFVNRIKEEAKSASGDLEPKKD